MAPANHRLSPEYNDRLVLTTLISFYCRDLCLNNIFNHQTMPVKGVLLGNQLAGVKSNINAILKTNMKFFVHPVQ